MLQQGHITREGHQWTEQTGLESGIPSIGVISPPSNCSTVKVHDVVVIGAGYAGLTALRDLTVAGHDVLLVEARDRIGGRTWSSNIDGYQYEMGGTWIHWNQPFVWREMARYKMTQAIEVSPATGQGLDKATFVRPTGVIHLSRDEEASVLNSAVRKFVNVDGKFGRALIPFPHNPHFNPQVLHYDRMSFADRFAQIEDTMTRLEIQLLKTFLSVTSGGTMENSAFFEFLRWWSLNNYDLQELNELCLTFKLRDGQSALARNIFDDAVTTGNLTYQLNSAVATVTDCGTHVEVKSREGQTFKARRAISTVPLNVLNSIEWSPPLLPGKRDAAALGHVNHCTKVHAEVANPALRSFTGWKWEGPLSWTFGDGTTPAGNTHLVAFGCSYEGIQLKPAQDGAESTLEAYRAFAPDEFRDIRRLVFHDWNEDEFAKGTWEFLRPNMSTAYLDVLRERQGNILFASADWAMGWRGFIDGGIEDGANAAMELARELKAAKTESQEVPVFGGR
ncbi:Fc.00g072520.m01.CDS01 [Cosmosporella sp. VM-42]